MNKISILILCLFVFVVTGFAQDTYKIGNTEYYYGKTYSTTGKPMVKRSNANKTKFLRNNGYSETPDGYEVDHIKPLSEGGTDDPSNMQLLTIEQHARKTAKERANRANSTYSSYPAYKSNSTYNSSNNDFSTPSSSRRTIHTGPRGGRYYINRNGNKTYVKTKKKSRRYNSSAPSYHSNRTIHTGPRGGKYYINRNGNKTYVKKKN